MEFSLSRFKNIETKRFKCEVVTPMFLGGADGRSAELRTASIKGALRFWWRVINHELKLKELKEKEAMLFGDAINKGEGKSKLKIIITNKSQIQVGKFSPLPHKNVSFRFEGIKPNQKFYVTLIGLQEHFALFELFSILGGLGKRSRRGFGAFKIIEVDKKPYEKPQAINTIMQLLINLDITGFIENKTAIDLVNEKRDHNRPFIKKIEIGGEFSSYEQVLKVIGQSSHDNNSDCTGFAKGNRRFSSPIYVSIANNDGKFCPIITTLNKVYKYELDCDDKAELFKKQILQN